MQWINLLSVGGEVSVRLLCSFSAISIVFIYSTASADFLRAHTIRWKTIIRTDIVKRYNRRHNSHFASCIVAHKLSLQKYFTLSRVMLHTMGRRSYTNSWGCTHSDLYKLWCTIVLLWIERESLVLVRVISAVATKINDEAHFAEVQIFYYELSVFERIEWKKLYCKEVKYSTIYFWWKKLYW